VFLIPFVAQKTAACLGRKRRLPRDPWRQPAAILRCLWRCPPHNWHGGDLKSLVSLWSSPITLHFFDPLPPLPVCELWSTLRIPINHIRGNAPDKGLDMKNPEASRRGKAQRERAASFTFENYKGHGSFGIVVLMERCQAAVLRGTKRASKKMRSLVTTIPCAWIVKTSMAPRCFMLL